MTSLPRCYFPAVLNPHTTERNVFVEYGSHTSADVLPSDTEGDKDGIKILPQKFSGKGAEWSLFAQDLSTPLLPPNTTSSSLSDPCMEELRNRQKQLSGIVNRSLFCKRTIGRKGATFEEARKSLGNILTKLQDPSKEFKVKEDFKLKGLGNLGQLINDFQDWGNNPYIPKVNSLYAGGCLKYQECPELQDADGLLVCPRGDGMNCINFHPVSHKNNQPNLVKQHAELNLPSRVFEVDLARVHNTTFCICREEYHVSPFRVFQDEEKKVQVLKLRRLEWPDGSSPTSVACSPYIEGECAIAGSNGVIKLWNVESRSKGKGVWEGLSPRFFTEDMWWGVYFGSHPRLLAVTDRTGAALYDIRSQNFTTRDLFHLPNPSLHSREKVFASVGHPTRPWYHFLATDFSLVMADERFPNHAVIHWAHSLLTPVQYLSISPACLPGLQDEDLIAASSQDRGETHCFQIRAGISGESGRDPSPISTSLPWKVSSPQDMLHLGCSSGSAGLDRDLLQQRLSVSLAGVATVPGPRHRGISVLQITAHGDLFSQTYGPVAREECGNAHKTCGAGRGSQRVVVKPATRRHCMEWLKAANDLIIPRDYEDEYNFLSWRLDASLVFDKFVRSPRPHVSCQLCSPSQDHDSRSETSTSTLTSNNGSTTRSPEYTKMCLACGYSLQEARDIRSAFMKEKQFPSQGNMWELNKAETVSLDPSLADIDVTKFSDPTSKIMVKVWNDDSEGLEELLKEQDNIRLSAIRKQVAALDGKTSEVDDEGDGGEKVLSDEEDFPVDEVGDPAAQDSLIGTPFQSLVNLDWSQLSDSDPEDVLDYSLNFSSITELQNMSKGLMTPPRTQVERSSDLLTIGQLLDQETVASPNRTRAADENDAESQSFAEVTNLFSQENTMMSPSQLPPTDPKSNRKRKRTKTMEGF